MSVCSSYLCFIQYLFAHYWMASSRSAQLRDIFEEMPPGDCKDFVRGRMNYLLRENHCMDAAMESAFEESVHIFPEIWVIMRGRLDGDWSEWDIERALECAGNAKIYHEEVVEWRVALERGEIVKGKGKGKGEEGIMFQGAAHADTKGKGKGKDFSPFSGEGRRLSE